MKIKDNILLFFIKYREQNYFIRTLSIALIIAGIGFFIGPLYPYAKFHINDELVTFKEFWLSGAGFAMSFTGLFLLFSGISITYNRNWFKYIFLTWFIGLSIIVTVFYLLN
ncbi:MAG: hypothetical protein KAI43_14030 [Candidatus Aureabacteria bacterium]|nr:hypothetical protein [Candidatus Auribacterota bacterium]